MLVGTQLFDEEIFRSLPPLLRLIPQAVSSSDFKELVGVQPFLDVRLRHGHMERSLWPFLPVSQQEC